MSTKLLFIFLLLLTVPVSAQQYIFGKVLSESGGALPNAVIYNLHTDQKVLTDQDGNFMIAATKGNPLRIIKEGYERLSVNVKGSDYSSPLELVLIKLPYDIAEVELTLKPTGDLKSDIKKVGVSKSTIALNSYMDASVKKPYAEVVPQLSVPSAFKTPNYSEGQVNVLGLVSAAYRILKGVNNPPPADPNYAETQQFHRRVKESLNFGYYTSLGFTEEDIDRLLIYADERYDLTKNHHRNFDLAAIDSVLKLACSEYIKTHKLRS